MRSRARQREDRMMNGIMNGTTDTTMTSTGGGVRHAATGPFRRLAAALRAFRQHRRQVRTVMALRALPDHALKDIGLDRSELRSAAIGDSTRRRSARVGERP